MKKHFITETPFLKLDAALTASLLPTDADLMAAVQQGDNNALATLFHRHQSLLKCAVNRILNDGIAAEDVVQDSLLEMWRHAANYSPAKGAPVAWMLTLARHRAVDHIRRSQAYGRACTRYEDAIKVQPSLAAASPQCEHSDLVNVLGEHLKLLPEDQQRVLSLAFLHGMSQREVARATRQPLGTVKTRIELGLKKLRRSFGSLSAVHSYQAA